MSRRVSQKSALALLVCFALCQPAVVVASTLSLTAVKSQPRLTGPNLRISHDSTTSPVPADRLSTETIKEKPEAESTEKTTKKKVLRSRESKTSKKSHLKSATTARKVSHHYKYLGNREDCDACHQQCLIASLACIAISIATACPVCGGVCLVYQDLRGISVEISTGAAEIRGIIGNGRCGINLIYALSLAAETDEIQFVRKAICLADSFKIQSLPPGRYYVVAIPSADGVNRSNQETRTKQQGIDDRHYYTVTRVVTRLRARGTEPLTLDQDQIHENTQLVIIDSELGAP